MAGEGNTLMKIATTIGNIIDKPVTWFRETVVVPNQSRNKSVYYHQKFPRVPTIDECDVDDEVCFFEAQSQFCRDKIVDTDVLNILRQRREECMLYYGTDHKKYCQKIVDDYEEAADNWFIKYGELGAMGTVKDAYMKQKHRMAWERRFGPVGTGMNKITKAEDSEE